MSSDVSIGSQIRDHLSRKVNSIAVGAADATFDTDIPLELIQLAEVFNPHKNSSHSKFVIETIWESELIPACVTCLNCDYSKVTGGQWQVAADLCVFVQSFLQLASLHGVDEKAQSVDSLVHSLLDNCVLLCRRIQTRYEMIAMSISKQKQTLLNAFKSILATIEKVGNTLTMQVMLDIKSSLAALI